MFHASSNSNKKIVAKHSENPLEMFFMRFQFTSFHRIPYMCAYAVCHFSRINCTRSQQIRRWTLNNVFETCATRLARLWEMLIAIHTNLECYAWNCITLIPCACYWHYCDSLTDWLTDWLIVFDGSARYLCLIYTFAIPFDVSFQKLWAEFLNFFELLNYLRYFEFLKVSKETMLSIENTIVVKDFYYYLLEYFKEK